MPPKRIGEPICNKNAEKIPKSQEATNANSGIEKASASQIQELELALDQNDNNSRVLHLAQEIAKTPDLPPNLTMRLLQFCMEVLGSEYVLRQLLENQTIDLKTPEGGKLLWKTIYNGRAEVAILLVRHGADLSVRYCDQNKEITLPHRILKEGWINDERVKLIQLMLDRKVIDVNTRDSEGISLLQCTIKNYSNHSYQLAEQLLEHGAQITINKDRYLDDIGLACKHKLLLLPKLIQHQIPDEETRNQRGTIAIDCLIAESYNISGAEQAAMIQMIKKILDLGVPVNSTDVQRQQNNILFLNRALWFKNKPAVKLLLEYGADPHQTYITGETALYLATAFKGYTHVSRWLIERDVNIHARNNNGRCPIHGACYNKSLRNIHLLLNIGADLNATDNKGCTPFGLMPMKETVKDKEPHNLIIKHFALIEARGGKISNADMTKTMQWNWSANHFDKCTKQLERMKEEKAYGNVTYFLLLSRNIYGTVQLMKNRHFLESFKKNQKKLADLFPDYFYMLLQSFGMAEKRLEVLLAEKKELHEVFLNAVPDHIVERIAYYLHFEKLERCQRDYYISFHETLKYTQADKAKIL